MTARAKKASLTQIGGVELKRFVVRSALLSLIDPVRGEATRTSLDEDPDTDISGGWQLKQKFLDSFALICSTSSSGAETASAVCLEQHASAETILRVARNRGLTPNDMTGLQGVLAILQQVAKKEKSSMEAESDILCLVVELDRGRILSMAEKIDKRGIRDLLREACSRLLASPVRPVTWRKPELRLWLESCPFTAASVQTWSPATVATLIDWAARARWHYPEQFRGLLGLGDAQKPPWLDSLHKIARYHSAIKSMVKLAAKQPEVLKNVCIQEIMAPDARRFSLLNEDSPLNLIGGISEMTMEQLERHLATHDVEARLRKACRLSLTLHAEMQMVVFYEGNPTLTPQMPFIGTSKKACFHCHEYLLLHPLKLRVSACHQKIYPSWMPPPHYSAVGFRSTVFARLGRKIEQLTKRELKTSLTVPRRPRNQDSTAGPSLTLTATAPTDL